MMKLLVVFSTLIFNKIKYKSFKFFLVFDELNLISRMTILSLFKNDTKLNI